MQGNKQNKESEMSKRTLSLVVAVGIVLVAGIGVLAYSLFKQKEANKEMLEIVALDKQEMQNEYERFALQYSELKTQINNDSLVAQLTQEQMKTQQLLEELKQVKATDAKEIARLKKELATMRAVLRTYVLEIDSLNRLNENLTAENKKMKSQYAEAERQIEGLATEKATLSEKVAIAAQLDATGIQLSILKSNGKEAKKLKDCRRMKVDFTIGRNVTASGGTRTFYVRITTPGGTTLSGGGNFDYEDKSIACSMKKAVEYTGEQTTVTLYRDVSETLEGGDYTVSIFADGNMIGSKKFTFKYK